MCEGGGTPGDAAEFRQIVRAELELRVASCRHLPARWQIKYELLSGRATGSTAEAAWSLETCMATQLQGELASDC